MNKAIIEEIKAISTPEQMMKFFDDNIVYGCIHVDGKRYVNSLGGQDFAEKYRTLSLDDSLNNRIGACFEQANISKYIYETLGIQHKTACTRVLPASILIPMIYTLFIVMSWVAGVIKS